jgi:Zn-dependent protease
MPLDISQWIVKIPVLLFALTLHEYAHGRIALWLGDPTAKRMGRLTLNPLPHIDPFGAICLFLFNFGWAKPVPVDPRYFRDIRKGIIAMSLAGPMANLGLALVAGILARLFYYPSEIYLWIILYTLMMNIGLALFNLLPIPPLDGSHVFENLLPPGASQQYRRMARYGPMILMAVILLDNFAHTGIIRHILLRPMFFLAHTFAGDNLFRIMDFIR